MKISFPDRRPLLRLGPLATAVLALPGPAAAQDGAVRLIIPCAPGGAIDAIARLLAPRLAALLGETWVVENRSGGSGVIGAEAVARAAPDGRMLMFSADGHLVLRHVVRGVPFDPVADFTPVARVAQAPLVLVGGPSVRAANLAELLAALRARPGDFAFANSALGSAGHLAAESFKRRAGVPDALVVTYRGTGPALNDVIAGQVALMMAPLLSALPQLQGGRLRAFGLTLLVRSAAAPGIPTLAEAGLPGVERPVWYGMWGPRALPAPAVERLNGAVRRVAAEPEVVRRLAELGCEPVDEDPAAFARTVQAEYARNSRIIAEAGIQPE